MATYQLAAVYLFNTDLWRNEAASRGGALALLPSDGGLSAYAEIWGSRFQDNMAADAGGAMHVSGGHLDVLVVGKRLMAKRTRPGETGVSAPLPALQASGATLLLALNNFTGNGDAASSLYGGAVYAGNCRRVAGWPDDVASLWLWGNRLQGNMAQR